MLCSKVYRFIFLLLIVSAFSLSGFYFLIFESHLIYYLALSYIILNTLCTIAYSIKKTIKINIMIEPLLFGIVLGLVPVTLAGLFVAAYLQYRRGNQFGL